MIFIFLRTEIIYIECRFTVIVHSKLLLARRPLSRKIRDVMHLMSLKTCSYRATERRVGMTKTLQEKFSNSRLSKRLMARLAEFRFKWHRRKIVESIGSPVRWAHTASVLHQIAPFTGGSVYIFQDTDEAYQSMWQAIDDARKNIRWATYICKDDRVGRETVSRLAKAAQRGVAVQFIYDDAGNISGREELLRPLHQEPNAHVMLFNPVLPKALLYFASFRWRSSPGIRNHRKILLVDDSMAFVGGLNIGNEYAGVTCGGSGSFRDTMCRLSGPIVEKVREAFYEVASTKEGSISYWQTRFAHQRSIIRKILRTPGKYFIKSFSEMQKNRHLRKQWQRMLQVQNHGNEKLMQCLTSNPWTRNYGIQRAYRIIISRCRHRIWITTPYFLPTRELLRAIIRASRRGVDVRIISGSRRSTDPLLMWWGSKYIEHILLKNNVKLFEYEGSHVTRKMHSKTLVADGVFCSIGSYNMDALSNKLLEISLSVLDYSLAEELESQFKKDMEQSNAIPMDECQKRTLFQRVLIYCIYCMGRAIEKIGFWSHSHPEVETSIDKTDL